MCECTLLSPGSKPTKPHSGCGGAPDEITWIKGAYNRNENHVANQGEEKIRLSVKGQAGHRESKTTTYGEASGSSTPHRHGMGGRQITDNVAPGSIFTEKW